MVDGSHNEDGSIALNNYLNSLNCKKHIIIGMMANKEHEKYISYFKDISSLTTVDIPNQPNSISGKELKEKFNNIKNINYSDSIENALKNINPEQADLILITGSLYLAGEVLIKLNILSKNSFIAPSGTPPTFLSTSTPFCRR